MSVLQGRRYFMRTTFLISFLLSEFFFFSCGRNMSLDVASIDERFLYTSSNAINNSVFRLNIQSDGTLLEVDTILSTNRVDGYATGGTGDADDGDFDGQNSIIIVDSYLLVINAGDHSGVTGVTNGNGSISVFSIDPVSGGLIIVDQDSATSGDQVMDSNGVRPVSLTSIVRDGVTWILVGNQLESPHYQDNSTDIVDALGTSLEINNNADNGRNIVAFYF